MDFLEFAAGIVEAAILDLPEAATGIILEVKEVGCG